MIDPAKSRLRVFVAEEWNDWHRGDGREEELDALAHFSAPLGGKLAFMQREASTYKERRCRAIVAWLFNRGIRDTWQAAAARVKDLVVGVKEKPLGPPDEDEKNSFCMRWPFVRDIVPALAQAHRGAAGARVARRRGSPVRVRAGDRRRSNEENRQGDRLWRNAGRAHDSRSQETHHLRKNVESLVADEPPVARRVSGTADRRKPPVLDLDVSYLTQQGVPILRILKQQDEVAAIGDLGALAGYFLRLLLSVHVWSFRKPDPADPGEPQRLPGIVKGLPDPEISEFEVACLAERPSGARPAYAVCRGGRRRCRRC